MVVALVVFIVGVEKFEFEGAVMVVALVVFIVGVEKFEFEGAVMVVALVVFIVGVEKFEFEGAVMVVALVVFIVEVEKFDELPTVKFPVGLALGLAFSLEEVSLLVEFSEAAKACIILSFAK